MDTSGCHGDTSRGHGDTSGPQGGVEDTSGLHGVGGTSGGHGDTSRGHGDTGGCHGDTSEPQCGVHRDTSGSQHGAGDTSGVQVGVGDTNGLRGAEDRSELRSGDTDVFCGDEDPNELQDGDPGASPEDLDLEQKVTAAILQQNGASRPPEPLLCFDAEVRLTAGGQRALLRLTPTPGPGPLFRDFFHFLRVFLPPMVRRRMGWRGGGQ
ncbi:oleosin-B4-like [Meleagris gallopavo]|uniref:oleosin-B4-like n=1 Tax=Meleagris gallopavo TaxID=9103 RepID=UPI0012ABC969|nr:oleosin-B4-like [Meleagris gallopavo]